MSTELDDDLGDEAELDDAFDGDFEPIPADELALDGLIRGMTERELAKVAGIPAEEVRDFTADVLSDAAGGILDGERALALAHATLDDVTRRAYKGLDEVAPGDRSDLLRVVVEVARLRAELGGLLGGGAHA